MSTVTHILPQAPRPEQPDDTQARIEKLLADASSLRWQIGQDFHEALTESIYTEAARIAERAVTRPHEKPRFDLDRTIDRIVTSRRHEPCLGLSPHGVALYARLLDYHFRGKRAFRDDRHAPARQNLSPLESRSDNNQATVVA